MCLLLPINLIDWRSPIEILLDRFRWIHIALISSQIRRLFVLGRERSSKKAPLPIVTPLTTTKTRKYVSIFLVRGAKQIVSFRIWVSVLRVKHSSAFVIRIRIRIWPHLLTYPSECLYVLYWHILMNCLHGGVLWWQEEKNIAAIRNCTPVCFHFFLLCHLLGASFTDNCAYKRQQLTTTRLLFGRNGSLIKTSGLGKEMMRMLTRNAPMLMMMIMGQIRAGKR